MYWDFKKQTNARAGKLCTRFTGVLVHWALGAIWKLWYGSRDEIDNQLIVGPSLGTHQILKLDLVQSRGRTNNQPQDCTGSLGTWPSTCQCSRGLRL